MPLQIYWAMYDSRSQSWRQSTANNQLALKARWQPVALGKAGRQMIMVIAVPSAHRFAVVIGIAVSIMIAIVVFFMASTVIPAMIVIAIFLVVTMVMVLSDC